MKSQYINFNGTIVPADQAVMTIANRGFRYGDGLFESMRWMKGELKFAELHADRIRRGMRILKFEGYSQIDTYFLRENIAELIRRNKTGPNARVRFSIFRDSEGLYNPTTNKIGFAIEVTKISETDFTSNNRGLIVDIYDEVPKPINILSNLKTSNSLVFVLAGVFKNQHSLDEVLILNQSGFLCEAMSSNVFVVFNKQLYTPALTEGCIAGVMRHVVMKLAKENNVVITEAQINPAILEQAEEVFLTNAAKGIQWVMGYNNKRYFNEVSRFLLNKLNKI
ncbi:MAG TPA: aminotransferase class IV [Daejeonella sp.]|nr:aminotransferase class IV [Daejeonella sp.]